MVQIATIGGKIIAYAGKVGLYPSCCCKPCEVCSCSSINNLNYTIRVNFSRNWGGLCTDLPLEIGLYSLSECNNGIFSLYSEIDTVLCDPEAPCGAIQIFLRLANSDCNCETGENCELELVGFEPVDCAGGIAGVELIQN